MNLPQYASKTALTAAVLSCFVPLTAVAQYADAQNYNPSWYLSAGAIGLKPDAQFGLTRNGPGAQVRVGKPVSEYWDIQMGVTAARSRNDTNSYRQSTLGVDALYLFSRSTIRPFVLIGAGLERDKASSLTSTQTHNAGFVNAGLGLQVQFTDQFGMQADYRRVEGFQRKNNFGFNRNGNNVAGLSFNYAFEKTPTRVASVAPAFVPAPVIVAQAPPPLEAPVVAPAPAPPPPPPRFEKYTLSATEMFAFNSDQLKMPQPKLDEIAAALNDNSQVTNVVATGYTDRIGSMKYNQMLSQRRAESVKSYLVKKGISPSRINAQGKGSANPVVTCTDKKLATLIQCLEPNRRVEVDQITIEKMIK